MASGFWTKLLGTQRAKQYLRQLVRERVPRPAKILNLPAGTGTEARLLRELGHEVVPAEYFPEIFQVEGLECQQCDWNEPLPWADEQFDGIVCCEGIEHVEHQAQFLRECARVLKPDGWMIITTPNVLNLRSRVAFLFTAGRSFRGHVLTENVRFAEGTAAAYHPHVFLINYLELRYLLAGAGMEIREVTSHQYSLSGVLLFWPLYPLVVLFTRLKLWRSKWNRRSPQISRQIARHLSSADVMFGKRIHVFARKISTETAAGADGNAEA